MRNDTRHKFEMFCRQVAELNGVPNVNAKFNVVPSVQQELEKVQQELVGFLQKINLIGVTHQEGEKVGIGVTGPIAGRTNTSADKSRKPRNVASLRGRKYKCVQTNFDTSIRYAQLDAWAHDPKFQILLRDSILIRQGLDRIMIGWNGESVADDTDLSAHPLLEDVNVGWIKQVKEDAPGQVISGVEIGGTDYNSLDGLAFDLKSGLPSWYRDDPRLVCCMGSELLNGDLFKLIDSQVDASNKKAAGELVKSATVGGLPPVTPPYFPSRAMLITRLDNLSIYYQKDSRRRHIKDNPEKDQVENYESSNDAYVIEDLDCAVMADKITYKGE